MDLIPPRSDPKPSIRGLVKALAFGGLAGAAFGAVSGYFTDDPFLYVMGPFGGAFAGFLLWASGPNVLWGRDG